MTSTTEALNDLNELLNEYHNGDLVQPFCDWTRDVLYKCKEALESQEQEPYFPPICDGCAFYSCSEDGCLKKRREYAERKKLKCTGCGSTMTNEELKEAKKTNPQLIACCPERNMVFQEQQQEPVGEVCWFEGTVMGTIYPTENMPKDGDKLYTHPAQPLDAGTKLMLGLKFIEWNRNHEKPYYVKASYEQYVFNYVAEIIEQAYGIGNKND